MLEYAGSQRAGRRERDALQLLAVVRSFDWILVAGLAALLVVGLWGIGGVTSHDRLGPHYYLDRQILYAAVGGAVLIVAALVDPDLYRRYWRYIFGGLVGLIAVVSVVGHPVNGATRVIGLGGFFTFQPSEFGKLLVVLALAGLLAERQRGVNEWGTTLRVLVLAAVPTFLVFIQPDLGTALVYLAAVAAMFFVAGTPGRHLATLGTIAALVVVAVLWAGPAVGVTFLKGYQQQRLTCFTHPSTGGRDCYNLRQSIITVGSGGIRGLGVNRSSQVNSGFLPAYNTDFAAASFFEQRGFVGAVVLLGLYLLVLWRGLRVVTVARDLFSAVVAGGIVLALFFQIFVNVGMTMGIAPITGIPLPFVSVGGSAMIANLAAMGVLLAIHARGRASRRRRA
jgi:rod shape determining protein RodA